MGAIVIGYVLGAFSVVPTIVVGVMILHAELAPVIAVACLQIVVLAPLILRLAKLAWIYLDYRADPLARGGRG